MLSQESLALIFQNARTYSTWLSKEISEDLLKKVVRLSMLGPTSANCSPLRIVFLRSQQAKDRLLPHLDSGNVEKTMNAPVTAIFAMDMHFYDNFHILFPHADAKSWFVNNEELIIETAFRNSSLQAAYFIIAARSLGLSCGPMSGFNKEGADKEFFPEGSVKSNFLCNLGYGDSSKLRPRLPRLNADDVMTFL
ncbi:putative malonic semialdehyde reductase RutE [Rickettsiales bacterium]|nr:putative malonic semialdehyde reductase RutE [Rickettsiales bacterium]